MKKIAMLFSILISVSVLTSCATNAQQSTTNTPQSTTSSDHHAHDYKGEG